ncbi:OmpA family protein [Roseobacter sp. YSTF-M11]|uniref:OmpA family protein n=1 Tax=Roseobacter insulae TaxID=2859783 RepID=A0A9X1FX67_9RHOB|nr:OmpA family protein [Roseobacter insulae]MBW4709434.1 OmpA family protein [Roseobacter insulae]
MTFVKTPIILALSGALVLSACTDPSQIGANSSNPKAQRGALIGAGAGAALGALSKGDGNRGDGAIVGALVGSAIGAGIGYSLDRQEADLRNQLGNDDVTITNTGDRLIVSLPQDILFATDSFAVRPDLQNDLYTVAGNLQQYPESTIQVVGHTDSDGDAAYNQQLSERRANAVGNVLRNAGVSSARIRTFGRGENQPVASNLSAQGKAQNRRVEIVILPNA